MNLPFGSKTNKKVNCSHFKHHSFGTPQEPSFLILPDIFLHCIIVLILLLTFFILL
ncbi:MAG: hypothetical protein PWP02_718 [Thermosipho sp. (in: thermotogales)]|nr:hypothetical protein [Thermosipho sp. (in: thermotogales)]